MRLVAAIVLILTISGCVQAHRQTYTVGDTYVQKSLVVGADGLSIPLPEGNWTVAGFHASSNNVNSPFSSGTLLRLQDGIVTGMIHYTAPQVLNRWGYAEGKLCSRDDIIYLKVNSNYGGREQDCWGINHLYMSPNPKSTPEIKQAWNYISEHKLKFPTTLISASYRLASNMKMLNVQYGFSPEFEGLSPPQNPRWSESEWHKVRINFHEDRLKYVEKIKKWASEWHPIVKANFDHHGK